MKTYTFILGVIAITFTSFIYTPIYDQQENTTSEKISKAFLLSEHEELVQELETAYTASLLSSCNNDVETAFAIWKTLIKDINAFATYNGMSLSGVKIWVKAFYSKDGQIEHLAYDFRENSKLINKKQFSRMLNRFIVHNETKLSHSQINFSHFDSIYFK